MWLLGPRYMVHQSIPFALHLPAFTVYCLYGFGDMQQDLLNEKNFTCVLVRADDYEQMISITTVSQGISYS